MLHIVEYGSRGDLTLHDPSMVPPRCSDFFVVAESTSKLKDVPRMSILNMISYNISWFAQPLKITVHLGISLVLIWWPNPNQSSSMFLLWDLWIWTIIIFIDLSRHWKWLLGRQAQREGMRKGKSGKIKITRRGGPGWNPFKQTFEAILFVFIFKFF